MQTNQRRSRRRTVAPRLASVTTTVVALVGAMLFAGSGQATGAPPGSSVIADERGCTEVAYNRNGSRAAVEPLVPSRFQLRSPLIGGVPATDRVILLVNELSCEDVTVEGYPTGSEGRSTTTLIVSASFNAVDGAPRTGVYVLWHATDNPVLFARYQQLGWPIELLSPESTFEAGTTEAGSPQFAFTFAGAGWDHSLTAVPTTAPGPVTRSTASYWHDVSVEDHTSDSGQAGTVSYRICYVNDASLGRAAVTGDLRTTPLASVTAVPPLLDNYGGFLLEGGWSSTLTAGDCPAPG